MLEALIEGNRGPVTLADQRFSARLKINRPAAVFDDRALLDSMSVH